MKGDECLVLLSVLKVPMEQAEKLISEADRFGFTDFDQVGPMEISLARIPGRVGTRTMNYQVTIK